MDYQTVTLDTLNMGAASELFEEAWTRLLENVADENTKATTVRSITLCIKVKPSEKRDNATTTVSVKESLAPLNPHEHFVVFGRDGRRIQAYTADPKQQSLGLEAPTNETPFLAAAGRK